MRGARTGHAARTGPRARSRGQAMIIDALFFLMICGMAAAVLAWASSVYGNQALEAYNYLYLSDIQSSTIQVLSETSYYYEGNKLFWMDQFGRYLAGQFNESDNRYALLMDEWDRICSSIGNPIILEIYPETRTTVCYGDTCADRNTPIILTCRFSKGTGRGTGTRPTSAVEEVLRYVTCRESDYNVQPSSLGLFDLGARGDPDLAHRMFLKVGEPKPSGSCSGLKPEPPFYASPKLAKLCYGGICDMYTKIYY